MIVVGGFIAFNNKKQDKEEPVDRSSSAYAEKSEYETSSSPSVTPSGLISNVTSPSPENFSQTGGSTPDSYQASHNSQSDNSGTGGANVNSDTQVSSMPTPTTQTSPSASPTPTPQPTPTPPPPPITSTVYIRAYQHIGSQDYTVQGAKVIVINNDTGAQIGTGVTDQEGYSPRWYIAANTNVSVYLYPSGSGACGDSWHFNTGPYGTMQVQHLRIKPGNTAPCIHE